MRACQQPLFVGRLLRVLAGVACLVGVAFVPRFEYSWLGVCALVLAGVTFIVAGWRGNAGCEITALPNLFRPRGRRWTCWCPLFSPLDRLERRLVEAWRSRR